MSFLPFKHTNETKLLNSKIAADRQHWEAEAHGVFLESFTVGSFFHALLHTTGAAPAMLNSQLGTEVLPQKAEELLGELQSSVLEDSLPLVPSTPGWDAAGAAVAAPCDRDQL